MADSHKHQRSAHKQLAAMPPQQENKNSSPWLAPIKAFRWRYLPLLMIYFAYGAAAFSTIADSFFVKQQLRISAHGLMSMGVWLSLPWTIKMVFGQLVDSIPIMGSNRRIYIFIAACGMAAGSIILAGVAGRWHWLSSLGTAVSLYFIAKLIIVSAMVLQDVVADAMSVDVVARKGKSTTEIEHELAMVQVLGRLALGSALFLVSGLGGWMAHYLSYQTIYLLTLVIPLISISGCLLVKLERPPRKPISPSILFGGLLFGCIVIALGYTQFIYNQEIVLALSLLIIIYFLHQVTGEISVAARRKIIACAIVIFVFRATPSVGPGLQWWQIDILGFNKAFFGTLGQIGAGLSILGMWLMAKYITHKPIAWILVVLTILYTLLSLPTLGMYYGLHHWTQAHFGFGAHTIAIIDTALESPFAQLSMIPMLTLIAVNAPRGNAATWFALMASLMNLALTAGALISKWLNHFWVVKRHMLDATGTVTQHADYSQLGPLIWISILCGFILPIACVLLFMRDDLKK